jgi:hypothetical protein
VWSLNGRRAHLNFWLISNAVWRPTSHAPSPDSGTLPLPVWT